MEHFPGLPFDLTAYDPTDTGIHYVVLKGFIPGCTDQLGAILATHGIPGCVVVHMSSEAEALQLWRSELTAGNRVACLGTASTSERSDYTAALREQLVQAFVPLPTAKSTPAQSSTRKLKRPEKRTDFVRVPDSLRQPHGLVRRTGDEE